MGTRNTYKMFANAKEITFQKSFLEIFRECCKCFQFGLPIEKETRHKRTIALHNCPQQNDVVNLENNGLSSQLKSKGTTVNTETFKLKQQTPIISCSNEVVKVLR